MEKIKSIERVAFYIISLFPIALLILTFIKGKDWLWYSIIIPIFPTVFWILIGITIAIFLPMSLISGTRYAGAICMLISSCIFGAVLWTFSLGVLWGIWGLIGTIIGLCLAVIGVTPLALIASLFSGSWTFLITILILAVCLILTRIIGNYAAYKCDENSMEEDETVVQ